LTRRRAKCSPITSNPICRCCGRCRPSTAAADEPLAPRVRCSTRRVHHYIPTSPPMRCAFSNRSRRCESRRRGHHRGHRTSRDHTICSPRIPAIPPVVVIDEGTVYHVAQLRQRFVGAVQPSVAPSSPRWSWRVLSDVWLSAKKSRRRCIGLLCGGEIAGAASAIPNRFACSIDVSRPRGRNGILSAKTTAYERARRV
jgi:hypothetical protein